MQCNLICTWAFMSSSLASFVFISLTLTFLLSLLVVKSLAKHILMLTRNIPASFQNTAAAAGCTILKKTAAWTGVQLCISESQHVCVRLCLWSLSRSLNDLRTATPRPISSHSITLQGNTSCLCLYIRVACVQYQTRRDLISLARGDGNSMCCPSRKLTMSEQTAKISMPFIY